MTRKVKESVPEAMAWKEDYPVYGLRVQVTKVMGECTGEPPSQPGDYFTVRDGDIRIPKGGSVCPWALQSLLPLITLKEREISEEDDEDSMRRVRYAQCPDPEGRVIFKIERVGKVKKDAEGARDIKGHKVICPDPVGNVILRIE